MNTDCQKGGKSALPLKLANDLTPPSLKSKRPQSWSRRWRSRYVRLLRMGGKPTAIARGLAIGVFAGCFPLFGIQIFIGIFLAAVIRGNKVAAAAGTWISNPLTYLPLFAFNFQVGNLLLGGNELSVEQLNLESPETLMESGLLFVSTLLLGCFVVGSIAAVSSYFISLRLLKRSRYSRRSKYNRTK